MESVGFLGSDRHQVNVLDFLGMLCSGSCVRLTFQGSDLGLGSFEVVIRFWDSLQGFVMQKQTAGSE